MAKQATGHVRWFHGVATARIRITNDVRESFALSTCRTDEEASERALVLADVAKRMRIAGIELDRARKALEMVATSSPRQLRNALAVASELVGGELRPQGVTAVPTFKQIGEQWTSGELAKQYPDQIRVKRSAQADVSRLTLYVYPVLQDIPIDRVTLDDCEEVMRRLPAKLTSATRQRIGGLMARIMNMAVYPLRLVESSPIPRGFLPGAGKLKALAYLYPDEDRRLLACVAVPLEYRLLWGFLSREGMREGEALALTWADVDLERGALRLDKNKTEDPRAWALDPGVREALQRFRDDHRSASEPNASLGAKLLADKTGQIDALATAAACSPHEITAWRTGKQTPNELQRERLLGAFRIPTDAWDQLLVFVDPHGAPFTKYGLADTLRDHLATIGLKKERPELFTTTPERRRIRVHDLRGTFVTVSLANGRSESWISDRTGHRSSQMIARYKRNARTFAELDLGELAPLAESIPELSIGPGLGRESIVEIENSTISVGHLGVEPRANGLRMLAGGRGRAIFGGIRAIRSSEAGRKSASRGRWTICWTIPARRCGPWPSTRHKRS